MAKRALKPEVGAAQQKVDSIAQRLHAALQKIDRPGTYCTSGAVPAVLPGLEVEELGPIGLPLAAGQAKELKRRCEQAPYGQGEKTLVDTKVRRVWRLKPEQFQLTNPAWPDFLRQTVAQVQEELGLEKQPLEPHLYELLLYEKGSFFLPHRDGEKLDRMVATLVIVLPSVHTGGELIVRHEGEERTIQLADPALQFHTGYAAFYADCEHEVRPLQSGHRLCLVYNLTLAKGKNTLAAPRMSEHVAEITDLLRQWSSAEDGPRKLAITMEHQYTPKGLVHLKGIDAAKARILAAAAREADCHFYAALVTLYQMGQADDDYYSYEDDRWGGRGRRGRRAEESASQHEMGEIYESSLTAEHWRGPGGERPRFGILPLEEEEIVPEESLTAVKPKEEFEGYTGNEGMTLQRWYHHAALVLWPRARHFEILCGGDGRQAAPALAQMVRAWRKAEGEAKETQRQQCLEFARQILLQWPESKYGRWQVTLEKSETANPLASLVRLGDADLIRRFIGDLLVKDKNLSANKWIIKAIRDHGWATFRPELTGLLTSSSSDTIERNVRLLDQLCLARLRHPGKPEEKIEARETCRGLAEVAVSALLKIDAIVPQYAWQTDGVKRAWLLPRLVRALLAGGFEDLLSHLIAHVLEDQPHYPLLRVQFPAIKTLSRWLRKNLNHASIPLTEWIAACRAKLESATAAAPEPPRDFRREVASDCKCPKCAELASFLLDPSEREHRFQAKQQVRDHLENQIRNHKLDLDCTTDRRPRPQVLICTKNMATYGRWMEEYRQNQQRLKVIRALENALPGA